MFSSVVGNSGIVTSGSMAQPSQSGAIYWDGSSKQFAIVDSYGNKNPCYAQVQSVMLDPSILKVVDWASKKMEEEKELADLCKLHPGLNDAKEKFDVMLALVRQAA
jgi:hypothetical protein